MWSKSPQADLQVTLHQLLVDLHLHPALCRPNHHTIVVAVVVIYGVVTEDLFSQLVRKILPAVSAMGSKGTNKADMLLCDACLM